MSDKADATQKPHVPEGTTKQTSESGPHGGGNAYNQVKISDGFLVQKPITGHTQKNNVDGTTDSRTDK